MNTKFGDPKNHVIMKAQKIDGETLMDYEQDFESDIQNFINENEFEERMNSEIEKSQRHTSSSILPTKRLKGKIKSILKLMENTTVIIKRYRTSKIVAKYLAQKKKYSRSAKGRINQPGRNLRIFGR